MDRRSFLFLQGPHGSFFRRLGEALAADGHAVARVNLQGGDRHDWAPDGSGGAVDYRGRFRDWALFADRLLVERGVTDLVLFGDCRPYHAAAHGMARLRRVRVHVVEEGYLRPDYMTLEQDGVNGNSRAPRDPDWFRARAAELPPPGPPPFVPSSFGFRARATAAYVRAGVLGSWRFPHYEPHRTLSPAEEALGWSLRWAGRGVARRRTRAAAAAYDGRPYFALPLQLGTDYQLRVHSPFADMAHALEYAVRSFAEHAPADTHLVVKRHPLDGSLTDWAGTVARLARRHGAGERVHYLPGRDTAALVSDATGVVTVNSTVGTLALNAGVPVCVLGRAVYDLPGLVHPGPLDAFWAAPGRPDAALYDAFRRVLVDRCLVAGGYGSEEGVDMLVEGARVRLTGGGNGATWG